MWTDNLSPSNYYYGPHFFGPYSMHGAAFYIRWRGVTRLIIYLFLENQFRARLVIIYLFLKNQFFENIMEVKNWFLKLMKENFDLLKVEENDFLTLWMAKKYYNCFYFLILN